MKILLLGASGYVGSRIYKDLKNKHLVTGTYFSNSLFPELRKLDITKKQDLEKFLKDTDFDILVHSANNPSSEWCKEHPEEARALNVTSSMYIANILDRMNKKLIYISTMGAINSDKNFYQQTKKEAEDILLNMKSQHLILRPSLGVGISPDTREKNFFNKLLFSIKNKTKFVADTSLRFQVTELGHMSKVIDNCIQKGIWNKIVPVGTEKSTSKFEFASDIGKSFDLEVEAINENRSPFATVDDLDKQINDLNLPLLSYNDLIGKVTSDIKQSLQ